MEKRKAIHPQKCDSSYYSACAVNCKIQARYQICTRPTISGLLGWCMRPFELAYGQIVSL